MASLCRSLLACVANSTAGSNWVAAVFRHYVHASVCLHAVDSQHLINIFSALEKSDLKNLCNYVDDWYERQHILVTRYLSLECCRLTRIHANFYHLPPTKEVCLSVCLLARLLKNACIDFDEMFRVDRCWDMDELINFWARSGLKSVCRNRIAFSDMRCNAELYYVGKIPRPQQRGVVLKWFYSLRAVGTPLSEVNALYRVPF